MDVFVKCRMGKGVFSNEWAVFVAALDGELSLFVDEYFVEPESQPSEGDTVPGRLRATMVEEDQHAPWVQLPVHSSPGVNRVQIPKTELVA